MTTICHWPFTSFQTHFGIEIEFSSNTDAIKYRMLDIF